MLQAVRRKAEVLRKLTSKEERTHRPEQSTEVEDAIHKLRVGLYNTRTQHSDMLADQHEASISEFRKERYGLYSSGEGVLNKWRRSRRRVNLMRESKSDTEHKRRDLLVDQESGKAGGATDRAAIIAQFEYLKQGTNNDDEEDDDTTESAKRDVPLRWQERFAPGTTLGEMLRRRTSFSKPQSLVGRITRDEHEVDDDNDVRMPEDPESRTTIDDMIANDDAGMLAELGISANKARRRHTAVNPDRTPAESIERPPSLRRHTLSSIKASGGSRRAMTPTGTPQPRAGASEEDASSKGERMKREVVDAFMLPALNIGARRPTFSRQSTQSVLSFRRQHTGGLGSTSTVDLITGRTTVNQADRAEIRRTRSVMQGRLLTPMSPSRGPPCDADHTPNSDHHLTPTDRTTSMPGIDAATPPSRHGARRSTADTPDDRSVAPRAKSSPLLALHRARSRLSRSPPSARPLAAPPSFPSPGAAARAPTRSPALRDSHEENLLEEPSATMKNLLEEPSATMKTLLEEPSLTTTTLPPATAVSKLNALVMMQRSMRRLSCASSESPASPARSREGAMAARRTHEGAMGARAEEGGPVLSAAMANRHHARHNIAEKLQRNLGGAVQGGDSVPTPPPWLVTPTPPLGGGQSVARALALK